MAIDGWESGSPPGGAAIGPVACSDWARGQQLDPVGNAGYYEGFLLVEQPLPWPFDVATLPDLVEVAALASSAGLRLQTVMRFPPEGQQGRPKPDGVSAGQWAAVEAMPLDGDGDGGGDVDGEVELDLTLGPDGPRRIICYRSARPGWAGPLVRTECLASPGSLAQEAAALVNASSPSAGSDDLSSPDADVLVCTHGRRDACCGARGIELLNQLVQQASLGVPVRWWRTSHTGGHRFAPTAIVLPAGTLWAWADPPLLRDVVHAQGDLGPLLRQYRGCATVGSPGAQALERAVLAEVGWDLFGSPRRAIDLGEGAVRLETELAGSWEATVREGRRVPQPDCRTLPELAKKQGVEWVVEGLRQVVPAG
ncbi:MAG TPA: sucrase ferredoxin [Acidimicrobiales bacterium]|nr:sucrase ferredoxin [Acidimicrobiales bacterium]